MKRKMRAAFVLSVVASLGWLSLNTSGPATDEPDVAPSPRVSPVESNGAPAEVGVDSISGNRVRRQPSPSTEHTSPPVDWPGDYKRTDFDLHRHFATRLGRVTIKELVRHVELNPDDLPVAPHQVRALEALLEVWNEQGRAARQLLKQVRDRECADKIALGSVAPAEVPRTGMGFLAIEEGMTHRDTDADAQSGGVHFAHVSPQAREKALAFDTFDALTKGTHIRHEGKMYLVSAFGHLPNTEAEKQRVLLLCEQALESMRSRFRAAGLLSSAKPQEQPADPAAREFELGDVLPPPGSVSIGRFSLLRGPAGESMILERPNPPKGGWTFK